MVESGIENLNTIMQVAASAHRAEATSATGAKPSNSMDLGGVIRKVTNAVKGLSPVQLRLAPNILRELPQIQDFLERQVDQFESNKTSIDYFGYRSKENDGLRDALRGLSSAIDGILNPVQKNRPAQPESEEIKSKL